MFSVNSKEENSFDLVVLNDHVSRVEVEVIPACGGILHAFKIPYNNELLNIVEQYDSKTRFNERVEADGFKSCKLSPFVCRLKDGQYHYGEQDYRVEKFYLGNHALHGLIYDASYDIVQSTANAEAASLELLFSYKATDKGFPFAYDCRVLYELKKDASLTITTFIKNHESTAIPMSDGWHPYFTFGNKVNELLLSFQSKEMLELDAELIPTKKKIPYTKFQTLEPIGDIKMDHGFVVDFENDGPKLVLRDNDKQLQLEIYPGKSYPILQLYIPGHRQSIAIENLSAAPDAFNNGIGLVSLKGGGEAVFSTTYRVTSID